MSGKPKISTNYFEQVFNSPMFQSAGMIGRIESLTCPRAIQPEGSVQVIYRKNCYFVLNQNGAVVVLKLCNLQDGYWLEEVQDKLWPWTVREIVARAAVSKMEL